ncbi:MAG TPA: tripartite tricarboxylate transporter substrate binding protein [Alphaproteobacteria bacterium]|nr:tripartite tricarboxylate transporter substrate binding protein [Alphaproteobacteria bacterium]
MTSIARVALWAALLATTGFATAPAIAADQYPSRTVKILVGFAPGGTTDVTSRMVAQKLSESLHQQFIIENRPGAGSNIAMGLVAKSAPDGYTILGVSSAFLVNPSLYGDKCPYKPEDFAPITLWADSPNVIIVNPSVNVTSLKQLIDLIHATPGKFSIATAGIGTTPDLSTELLRMTYKLDAVRVPFNGGAPAAQAVLQGQTQIGFDALPPAAPLIKAGQLRAVAMAYQKRSALLPDVSTTAEQGIPGQESHTIAGFLVPAATPKPIVELLYKEMAKAVADPTVRQNLAAIGFEPVGGTPAEFAALIKDEVDKWGKVVRAANIKVE